MVDVQRSRELTPAAARQPLSSAPLACFPWQWMSKASILLAHRHPGQQQQQRRQPSASSSASSIRQTHRGAAVAPHGAASLRPLAYASMNHCGLLMQLTSAGKQSGAKTTAAVRPKPTLSLAWRRQHCHCSHSHSHTSAASVVCRSLRKIPYHKSASKIDNDEAAAVLGADARGSTGSRARQQRLSLLAWAASPGRARPFATCDCHQRQPRQVCAEFLSQHAIRITNMKLRERLRGQRAWPARRTQSGSGGRRAAAHADAGRQ